ncbi:hypothetical protein LguiA_007008 [Lonicera macranthoides]
MKAFKRLGKVLPEADILQLVGSMGKKNGADMYVSDYSSFVVKRNWRETNKKLRRRKKEWIWNFSVVESIVVVSSFKAKRLQDEAWKGSCYLRSKNSGSTSHNDQSSSTKVTSPDSSSCDRMDSALSQKDGIKIEDMWNTGALVRTQKPKTELVKEFKLTTTKEMPHDDELNLEKLVNGWYETNIDGRSGHRKVDGSLSSGSKCNHKLLLQFDKSNRPAFYGL